MTCMMTSFATTTWPLWLRRAAQAKKATARPSLRPDLEQVPVPVPALALAGQPDAVRPPAPGCFLLASGNATCARLSTMAHLARAASVAWASTRASFALLSAEQGDTVGAASRR